MASQSSPCFRKQHDTGLVGSRSRRLKSENYIHRINWESLQNNRLSPAPGIPREIRNLLLWGSGDTPHSLAGDYNLPLHREDVSSSQSSDSITYEFFPRCSISDSVFYTMKRNDANDSGLLLFPSVTSISLTSENEDDNDPAEGQSMENILVYSLEELFRSSDEAIRPTANLNNLVHSTYPNSASRQINSQLNTAETSDSETMIESRNHQAPLVTAGSIRLPKKLAKLKKKNLIERATENVQENIPLLKEAIPLPKDLPIGKKKRCEKLKNIILKFCGTICPCCPLRK